ncbi:NAD(P)-dependent oxidoreductase [Umezawaea sp.]|uniref:NAD-dependent epimerase/dehydratase family protein n=1 Tax=Umezawaea sp. TaxID=1955258 RepID=UPI002ED5BF20
MNTELGTVVVTGAAGQVARAVRAGLHGVASRVVLADLAEVAGLGEAEESLVLDVRDEAAVVAALAGADAVVHLGGIPDEAPLPDLLTSNVLGTHHILEAARLHGLRRVVLASSNRLTGFYPTTQVVSPTDTPRPDGLYGVSKVAVEALARLYADKFGVSVVCLRIGSFEAEPSEPRHRATWLSPRDCTGFINAALTTPNLHFETAYAVSANTNRFWELSPTLGYTPVDNAETYGIEGEFEGVQGGTYAGKTYTLPHLNHS